MSNYIQRGPQTRYRNHLMVEAVTIVRDETTVMDRVLRAAYTLGTIGAVGVVIAMVIMSMQ